MQWITEAVLLSPVLSLCALPVQWWMTVVLKVSMPLIVLECVFLCFSFGVFAVFAIMFI